MIRTRFSDGRSFRRKVNRHAEMAGGAVEWTPVTLPHDAMIGTVRSPSATSDGLPPRGTWEYRKDFSIAGVNRLPTVLLPFDGVYRDARVEVNGTAAGHWPYGYSTFDVPTGHLLSADADNEVTVTARCGDDSRWHAGAGIHRDVWLLQGGAVVAVTAVVRNNSSAQARTVLSVEVLDAGGVVVARDDAAVTAFPGDALTVRRALAVVRPTGDGTITVAVTADGCEPRRVTIEVRHA